MRSPRILAASLGLSLLFAGCAGMGVRVVRLGAEASPRPAGCAIEFFEKRPERPYEELAELSTTATAPDPSQALQVLREPACRLGADALLVTGRVVANVYGKTVVAGIALRWLPSPAEPPATPDEPSGARSL